MLQNQDLQVVFCTVGLRDCVAYMSEYIWVVFETDFDSTENIWATLAGSKEIQPEKCVHRTHTVSHSIKNLLTAEDG